MTNHNLPQLGLRIPRNFLQHCLKHCILHKCEQPTPRQKLHRQLVDLALALIEAADRFRGLEQRQLIENSYLHKFHRRFHTVELRVVFGAS